MAEATPTNAKTSHLASRTSASRKVSRLRHAEPQRKEKSADSRGIVERRSFREQASLWRRKPEQVNAAPNRAAPAPAQSRNLDGDRERGPDRRPRGGGLGEPVACGAPWDAGVLSPCVRVAGIVRTVRRVRQHEPSIA